MGLPDLWPMSSNEFPVCVWGNLPQVLKAQRPTLTMLLEPGLTHPDEHNEDVLTIWRLHTHDQQTEISWSTDKFSLEKTRQSY